MDPSAKSLPPLAPAWHTAVLVALYLAVAATGTWLSRHGGAPEIAADRGSRAAIYLQTIAVQLALAVYVVRVGRPRAELASLVGWRTPTARRACVDLALAAALWLSIRAIEMLAAELASGRAASVAAILPRTVMERATWVVFSFVVGFCEELVFRGYLRIQLTAFTRSARMGVVGQAILFGIAHAEQGVASAARIAVYGLAFGVVAHARKSIVPGAIAHAATDLASGLFG